MNIKVDPLVIRNHVVTGHLDGILYATSYKAGSHVIRKLSDNYENHVWNMKTILSEDKGYVIYRDPTKRFYSGLVQASTHPYQRKLNNLEHIEVPPVEKSTPFFIYVLNNYYYNLSLDMHLAPWHKLAYRLIEVHPNLTPLPIEKFKPKGLNEHLKHTNSRYYPYIEQALNSGKIKKYIEAKIEKYLEEEYLYYNKLAK